MLAQLKRLYPKWLPYPISGLRTVVLILLLGPTGSLISVLGMWGTFGSLLAGSLGDVPFPGVPILLSMCALVLLLPKAILAYVYHIFTLIFNPKAISGRHPRWFPTWQSWREGITGVVVMGLSLTISMLVILWYRPDLIADRDLMTPSEQDALVTFFAIVWFISAAYLYQWDYLVRQKRAQKRKTRQSPHSSLTVAKVPKSTPEKPIDEIEIELNRLKGEMGLHQMKTHHPRKPKH